MLPDRVQSTVIMARVNSTLAALTLLKGKFPALLNYVDFLRVSFVTKLGFENPAVEHVSFTASQPSLPVEYP